MRDDKEKVESKTSEIQEFASIYSQEEIKNIVKGFVEAYISGDMKIKFASADELVRRAKADGEVLDYATATKQEIEYKKYTIERMEICTGTKSATPDELKKAINELFARILWLRSSNRLDGRFMKYSSEERLQKLEDGLAVTNNLIQEILAWLKTQGYG